LTDFLLECEKSSVALTSISAYFTACQAEELIEIERHCKEHEAFELHRDGKDDKKMCTLFDLTLSDVNPPESKPESIGVRVIPELEKRFLSRLEALSEYIRDLMRACGREIPTRKDGATSYGVTWPLQTLTEEKQHARECEETCSLSHARACALAHEHSRILIQSLAIISDILKTYKYGHTLYYDTKVCEALEKRCQTMHAKLEMLHHSLIRETYSQEAVSALKKIRYGHITLLLMIAWYFD
jgi:hypothetical protein